MAKRLLAAIAALILVCPVPLAAKAVTKDGFTLPAGKPVKIIVFRPDVQVGSLTVGGVDEPNADWTTDARNHMAAALKKSWPDRNSQLVFPDEPAGDDGAYVAEYRFLFRAVANAIMIHKLFPGQRLPTKKEAFDWSLGKEASRLGAIGGGQYALFFSTHDAYGTSGRKTAQIFGAMLGVAIQPGVHIGYAGLVDLATGEVVWFNADPQMGGDVRTADGSEKRVGQLLADFPVPIAVQSSAAGAK